MDRNIKELWGDIRSKAILEWRDSIGSVMEPELEKRGIKVNSYSLMDPAPGNEVILIWACLWGEKSLEIQAHSANSFSATYIDPATPGAIFWPSAQSHIYDRKNYTIAQLLAWIDSLVRT